MIEIYGKQFNEGDIVLIEDVKCIKTVGYIHPPRRFDVWINKLIGINDLVCELDFKEISSAGELCFRLKDIRLINKLEIKT